MDEISSSSPYTIASSVSSSIRSPSVWQIAHWVSSADAGWTAEKMKRKSIEQNSVELLAENIKKSPAGLEKVLGKEKEAERKIDLPLLLLH